MSQLEDSQSERVNSPLLHLLFYPGPQLDGATYIGEGRQLYSV